jgi:VanZ family protein
MNVARASSRTIQSWAITLGWMILIFCFSTDLFSAENTAGLLAPLLSAIFPALRADQLELIHYGLRKLGHLSEYFILAVLLMRALLAARPAQRRVSRLVCALTLATLYGASDEWHQSFVPSRTASVVDVMIDSCGAFWGTMWYDRRRRKAAAQ